MTQADIQHPTDDDKVYLNAQQIIELATQYLSEGKLVDVVKLCDKLIAWREDHGQAWFYKSLVAHAEGKLQDALEYLKKTEEATDLIVPRLLLQGRCHAGLGDIGAGLTTFQKALDFQPDNAEAYYWVGLCLKEKQDLTDARSFLRRTTLIDPGFGPAWYEQGNVALLLARYDEAIRAYRKAIELIPEGVEIYNNLALALQAKGDHSEAVSELNRALAINPNYAEAHANLFVSLTALGQSAEAEAAKQKAVVLQPSLADVLAQAE
jgi:tetratricopeptide (TPR) repeat protein